MWRRPVPAWLTAAVLLTTFTLVIVAGMLTDHWRSEVPLHDLAMTLWHQGGF